METQPRIIGKARGYRDFIAVLRAFFEEKQITRETIDEHCGLTARHASRLLTTIPLKNFGPTSLTLMLQRNNLELWVVETSAQPDDLPKRRRAPNGQKREMPVL